MADFMEMLNQTLTRSEYNRSVTENGAIGYETTGKKLLDFNFAVSSMRNWSEESIQTSFSEVYGENPLVAVTWLFFARDIRGGMGERRTFRACLKWLANEHPETCKKILHLVPEYGRWDDLFELMDTKVCKEMLAIVDKQLHSDLNGLKEASGSISLLGKWLPSINSHSKETRKRAVALSSALYMPPRTYQSVCTKLRKRLKIAEKYMSANQWSDIDYEAVPSKANALYRNAFLRHDEDRRKEYLASVEKGEKKINSDTLFPHDIVAKYKVGGYSYSHKIDQTLEELWKALPNTIEDEQSTIVVADGSGSMFTPVSGSVYAIDVANALAIYFSERLHGHFWNKYITFSARPQLVNLGGARSLNGKLRIADSHNECSNTNIRAVFNLLLRTAVNNNVLPENMPHNVLVISDMEFDHGANDVPLFSEIAEEWEAKGYHLPRLVFWNVSSRTNTVPVIENPNGVALVSGFSPNVAKMVMSGKLDPYEALLETLNTERYDAVREALT